MKHIKLFEEYSGKNKTIVILGLPGSGKSYLAKKIQRDNPEMNYYIYDDFESRKALANTGKENQIISDGMLMMMGADSTFEKVRDSGAELEIIYFENDPDKAYSNTEKRKNSGESLDHQKRISYNEIMNLSNSYSRKIPSGTKTIPICATV